MVETGPRAARRRCVEIEAAALARTAAEERYLNGHPALFANAIAAWEVLTQSGAELTAMAMTLAQIDGVESGESEDALAELVAARLADLVEPAKATALEKLGEGERGPGSPWPDCAPSRSYRRR